MRIALHTVIVSPHQMPLAREVARRVGVENYRCIYQMGLSAKRRSIGWSETDPDVRCLSEEDPEARKWLETCDVLMTSFRDCDLIERRAKRGLRTLYSNERWFKPFVLGGESRWRWTAEVSGFLRMLVPGFRRMAKRFVGLVNGYAGVGILAIGPWAKRDFLRLGVREEKIVDWGYFVESAGEKVERRGEGGESRGTSLKILWAGRDIPLKRVKDIERAVSLANKNLKDSAVHRHLSSPPLTFTKLTGVSADMVRKAMSEHDVFVFASNAQEGWGAVVNEALEEGMRVIGTFEAGASAAMLPKGRLYHAGDVKALAALLEKEFRGELPPCLIGEWSAKRAADRLMEVLA